METLMSGLMLIAFLVAGGILLVICLFIAAVLALVIVTLGVCGIALVIGGIVLTIGKLHAMWVRGKVSTLDSERKANESRKAADEATTELVRARARAANAGRPIPAAATP